MRLYIFIACCILSFASSTYADPSSNEWETFGDWEVKAVHGEMDPYTNIMIRTKFNPNIPSQFPQDRDLFFGFNIYSETTMIIYPTSNFGGSASWPECDNDSDTFIVSDSKPRYISTIDNPGGCNRVSIAQTIKMFKSGHNAKLRLNHRVGQISLTGFSSAYARAQQLSHQ